jgi:hypothetical protein
MAEPTVSGAAAAMAYATGTITITGSFLGLQYDLLLVGMAGGLVALSMFEQTTRVKMAFSVFTSALLAGYIAPVLNVAAIEYFPWTMKAGDALRWFCAFGAGLFGQTLVPLVIKFLRNRGGV